MFAVTQVALLVVIELCVVAGLALAAIRWHRQSQRDLPADIDHHRDVVADYEAMVDTHRVVTQLESEDLSAPIESKR
jgi:ribosome-binding protein aMBF1 (putative translation factor)